jgi:hypothetical protein
MIWNVGYAMMRFMMTVPFFHSCYDQFFPFLTSVKYDQNILKFSSLVNVSKMLIALQQNCFLVFFVLVKYDDKVLKTVFASTTLFFTHRDSCCMEIFIG